VPIAVIDYGSGNLRSVQKALESLGFEAVITGDRAKIASSSGIILPGVGAFDSAVLELRQKKLDSVIIEQIGCDKPFLGLCLGMQLLLESSEEGTQKGLGIIKGTVKKFSFAGLTLDPMTPIKVPQMGWNNIKFAKHSSPIMKGVADGAMMYFVHSYYCEPVEKAAVLATTDYGITFASAIEKENLYAFQFHPEKSSKDGLKLLKNFGELCKKTSR